MSTIEKALKKAGKENQHPERPDVPVKENKKPAMDVLVDESFNLEQNQEATENTVNNGLKNKQVDKQSKKTTLDIERLTRQGFLTEEAENTQQAEEYRTIKRPLVLNALSGDVKGIERSNLILVTSSVPSEGKTFTAINLALSIANERDKRVLLIDADVAKPSVAKALGVRSRPGLIEYLEGADLSYADISIETQINGLSIIPAGKRHGYSTELLASNKMLKFAEELSKRYPDRIVIFDSPPLLVATQAEVLAGLVGQVVLVIESESTLQSTVQESLRKLEDCDVVLGLLNKTQKDFAFNYYGYGGYYGYGAYGDYGNDEN